MRILLTGSSGQVGGALLAQLIGRHEVLTPGRSDFDLSRPETLAAVLDRLRPDLVINPAAYTAVERAEDEPDLARMINAEAPAALAHWAAPRQVPLIHYSTDYVFAGGDERPWREEDPCAPLSIYGRSKWEGEKAVQASGAGHLIIRTSWVYAAQGSNFLNTICRLAGERDELDVVADQFGAPTSADSLAEAVSAIISSSPTIEALKSRFAAAQGLVHATNSGSTTWHGFACAILNGLRARGRYIRANSVRAITSRDFRTKAVRPANSRLDLSRLQRTFGITMPAWDAALSRVLDHIPLQS